MKTVDLIIDDKIKYPPDKETSAKTFRAGARCFSGGFFLRGGYQIGDFYEFLQIIVFGQHIQNIASFFGTFDVSLPFAGPLSDKLGRRISVLIGAASYVIFFIGIAFSPNIQVAYVAAVLGGIAIGILGVLAIFAPMPAGNAAAKSESFISSLKNANFSVESIALVMIASSLCNYTILSAAAKMSSMQVIMMNIVITVIGVLLAVFVNVRYGSLLAKTEQ